MSFAMAEEAASAMNDAVTTAVVTATPAPATAATPGPAEVPPILNAFLGYLVVFIGLILLMAVVIIVGKIMVASEKKSKTESKETPVMPSAPVVKNLPAAPGAAGEVKIYDTDPRDAAMIMAIVADKLQKPLNELRFVSIKEVK